ncbi:MAG TPA: heavy metal translocating P-type ATPase [Bacilli bacterium]|nr:heavy metal translocating P-type ATPase [Bacilli bacterium]
MKTDCQDTKTCAREHTRIHFIVELTLYFIGVILHILAYFSFMPALLKIIFNLVALVLAGHHVLLEGIIDTVKNSIKTRSFKPNIHILMTLGAVGAIILGEYGEATLLILIFAGAHFLEEYAESRSKKEITSLLALNPTNARKLGLNDEVTIVAVDELNIGDRVLILPGDQIAADGIILSGESVVDEKSITGESMPSLKTKDSLVFASTINAEGTLVMEVMKKSSETVFAKIIELVKHTQTNITKTAAFIKKFEPIYVTIVILLAPLYFLFANYVLPLELNEAFRRTMILLIGASPCALAVSDIPASLSALSNLAKRGVLFKGSDRLSLISESKAVVFDKTGTLTNGEPAVTDVLFIENLSESAQTDLINIVVSMEKQANHPLANAIITHFALDLTLPLTVKNIIGVGLEAVHAGVTYKIMKSTSFKKVPSLLRTAEERFSDEGKTTILVSADDEVKMLIATLDAPKESACAALTYLRNQGIYTVMLTGDSERTSEAIGKKLGVDEIVSNVLPHEKKDYIDELRKNYQPLIMVGDGVNDAPALVSSDVGIAMGDGTDVAIEVADAVLVKNDLTKVVYAHKVSKKLSRVVVENIIFALAVVLFLVVINTVFPLPMWAAVTVHEGSTLVVIINGLRLLRPINVDDIFCETPQKLEYTA